MQKQRQLDPFILQKYEVVIVLLGLSRVVRSTITYNFLSFSVECNGTITTARNNIFVYVNGLLLGEV